MHSKRFFYLKSIDGKAISYFEGTFAKKKKEKENLFGLAKVERIRILRTSNMLRINIQT